MVVRASAGVISMSCAKAVATKSAASTVVIERFICFCLRCGTLARAQLRKGGLSMRYSAPRHVAALTAIALLAGIAFAKSYSVAAQEQAQPPRPPELTEQQRLRAQTPGGGLTPGVSLP